MHLIVQKYTQILKERAVSSIVMQQMVSSAIRPAGRDSRDSCDCKYFRAGGVICRYQALQL